MRELTEQEFAALKDANQRYRILMQSKSDRKRYGKPGEVREAMRARFLTDALKLAIAEAVFARPKLYGADMVEAYMRRCKEVFE